MGITRTTSSNQQNDITNFINSEKQSSNTTTNFSTNTKPIEHQNGDCESLQYLKPATDDQTVAWSEGTRVTDLLF